MKFRDVKVGQRYESGDCLFIKVAPFIPYDEVEKNPSHFEDGGYANGIALVSNELYDMGDAAYTEDDDDVCPIVYTK